MNKRNNSFPCRLRGPVAADLHRPRFAPPLETSPPRHPTIFARRVLQIVRAILDHPAAGRVVPEYGDKNVRKKVHLGYRIVYHLTPNAVEIVASCHRARLIERALKNG